MDIYISCRVEFHITTPSYLALYSQPHHQQSCVTIHLLLNPHMFSAYHCASVALETRKLRFFYIVNEC